MTRRSRCCRDSGAAADPADVGISDAGGSLALTCEVMNFNVNQNLEEVISADVTLKPTQSSTGTGINVGFWTMSVVRSEFSQASTMSLPCKNSLTVVVACGSSTSTTPRFAA